MSIGALKRSIQAQNALLYNQKYNYYKMYYGMALGHFFLWSLTSASGYYLFQKHYKDNIDEQQMILMGGTGISLFSLGCILMVHKRAKYSIATLKLQNNQLEIQSNRMFSKIQRFDVTDVRLIEPRSKIMIANSLFDIFQFHFKNVYKLETGKGTFYMHPDGVTNQLKKLI
jgi:hypothetical protein